MSKHVIYQPPTNGRRAKQRKRTSKRIPAPNGLSTEKSTASELCDECSRINFDAFFDPYLQDETHVWRNWTFWLDSSAPDCALCRLVFEEALENALALEWLSVPGFRNVECSLIQLVDGLPWEDQLNILCDHALTCSGTGWVTISPFYGQNGLSPSDIGYPASRGFSLERLDDCRQLAFQGKLRTRRDRLFVQRLIPAEVFDIRKLHDWLRQYDQSRESTDNSTSTPARLKDLIQHHRFRVIDVTTGAIYVPEYEVRYVALSYVWGQLSLTYRAALRRPIVEGISLLDISSVPQTILDAMKAVRSIGERYLWIDSVCVDQFDSEDKEFIIARMGSIFSSAYATLVAASGEDAHAGLGRLVGQKSVQETVVHLKRNLENVTIVKPRLSLEVVLSQTEWNTRGWTFQEAARSPACIICTRDEIFFQSDHFKARESYEPVDITFSSRLRKIHLKPIGKQPGEYNVELGPWSGLYQSKVSGYSERRFTYPGDRMDAFLAIAEAAEADLSIDDRNALSGLSYQSFANDLNWTFSDYQSGFNRINMDHRKSRYLPSWSWVGWDNAVRLLDEKGRHLLAGPHSKWTGYNVANAGIWIIDKSNIAVNLAGNPWVGDIVPTDIAVPLQVTLHLWTQLIGCHFSEALLAMDGTLENEITRTHIRLFHPDRPGTLVLLDEYLPAGNYGLSLSLAKLERGSQAFLVPIGGYSCECFIVEAIGDFYERVGDFRYNAGPAVFEQFVSTPRYIRVR